MKLWVKILIALVFGTVTGLFFPQLGPYTRPVGDIFLSLINMIIVLLVLSSMAVGVTSIHDPKKLGRLGTKSLLLYLMTTVAAILFGLLFSWLFDVGSGLGLQSPESVQIKETPTIGKILLGVIPSNPLTAMVEGNILQVVVFSIFLGIAINFSGNKGKPLRDFLESLADVMYRLTSIIMEFSPVGVFALMVWVSGRYGAGVLLPLVKLLLAFHFVCVVHILVIFCGIIHFRAKLHPWPFFRGMGDAIMMAFSTASSSATLPVSMHCIQENIGVSKNISNFVLPLGSTVNMNGLAIWQAMAITFIANAYGIPLSWQDLLTVTITATLSAIGAAGVPGTGFIMMTMVLNSIGLPLEGLALIVGIDRIREMTSTVLNILGDGVVALYLAKSEGEFNERQYYNPEIVEIENIEM